MTPATLSPAECQLGAAHRPSGDRLDVFEAPPLDPRVMPWRTASLVRRACPACGASAFDPIVRRPDGLLVGRCSRCTLSYLPDIPKPDAIAAFYQRYSGVHQGWHGPRSPKDERRAARRRRGGNGLLNEIARRRAIAGARLLEIGCSRGSSLLDAREAGASVSGIEIDPGARRAVNALGIPCHASIAEATIAAPFDIVLALNVIEHLTDPGAWLREVSDALAANGLLVLWTPNGAQADVLGAGWVGFRVDMDHLAYYSARTLAPMLLSADLWPEAVWEFSQAELSGFSTRGTPPQRTRTERCLDLARRAVGLPRRSWALPPAGGAYTLCMFAGKSPVERRDRPA